MLSDAIKEWCVIFNPKANDGAAVLEWPKIEKILLDEGFDFELQITASKRHAIELTKHAIFYGYRKFLVVGGGGTINEVLNGIMTQDYCDPKEIVFTNIPVGVFNDWPRHHKLPSHYAEWIPKIKDARVVLHDVGKFTYMLQGISGEAYFMGFLGTGISASVVKRINDNSLNLTGKGNLFSNIAQVGLGFKKDSFTARFNEQELAQNFFFFNVNINKYAAGFYLAPHSTHDDGVFHITYNKEDMKYFNMLTLYRNMFLKQKFDSSNVLHDTTDHCTIESSQEEPCYVQADGEFFGEAPCEVWMIPQAVKMIIP